MNNQKQDTNSSQTCRRLLLTSWTLRWGRPALSPPGRSWAGGGAYRTTSSTAKSSQRRRLWGWTGSPSQHLWDEQWKNTDVVKIQQIFKSQFVGWFQSVQQRFNTSAYLHAINLTGVILTFAASSFLAPSSSASLWTWPERWWGSETDGRPSCPRTDPTDPP